MKRLAGVKNGLGRNRQWGTETRMLAVEQRVECGNRHHGPGSGPGIYSRTPWKGGGGVSSSSVIGNAGAPGSAHRTWAGSGRKL